MSKHRNYTNGTPRLRHFPLYVGTGHASDILRSNAVNKFSINALKLSKLEIDQNFEGVYPKLCVTLERTFGTSRMEKLKRYFNFALDTDRRPPHTMYISYGGECTSSAVTATLTDALETQLRSDESCKINNKDENLRRSKRDGKMKRTTTTPPKTCTPNKKTKGNYDINSHVYTIGMLQKKSDPFVYVKTIHCSTIKDL